ncbi:hypothetical protein KUTeg_014671 [Tegillarca granosa]|uniref:Uncharacterized protein n=1 Tax=Tegillarca granosa TaxID=220873 RepID=A0ABQ9ERD5_TEGGR|nr:hypothetical protein KUTeg_014671 [Tegillarca granosa]
MGRKGTGNREGLYSYRELKTRKTQMQLLYMKNAGKRVFKEGQCICNIKNHEVKHLSERDVISPRLYHVHLQSLGRYGLPLAPRQAKKLFKVVKKT